METTLKSYSPAISFALSAVISALLSLWWQRWRRRHGNNNYPPLEGTALNLLFHYHQIYDYLTDISGRHKTFRFLMGINRYEIYTVDPAIVEHILSTKFHLYGKGSDFSERMKDLFGEGIFVVGGEKWLHQRKLSSRQFSTRFLKEYSSKIFNKNAAKLAEIISRAASSGEKFDAQDLFMRSTMDSIFEVAFGMELNCLHDSEEEGREFARAFDESASLILWRFLNPIWRLERFLNTLSEAKLRKNINEVDEYVYKMINTKISKGLNQIKQGEDILSRFLLEREENPDELSLKYLRDIILNFVIAGKDTTSGTLSWFFFILSTRPSVQEKVFQEVQAVVGNAESFDDLAMGIMEESLVQMNYLRAALSETLRLYPAVPVDSKMCFKDDKLPGGFDMRKGDVISYQPYAMGRMKWLWGEDAEEFRPERWLDKEGVFRHESPFKFNAFQAGTRICLGKDFAYRQMMIFAAVLVRNFTFELGEKGKAVVYKPSLTLNIDGGLSLRAWKR